eukprot:COSAG03_NODE_10_length_23829_cov_21.731395_14_plen_139_part_00
MIASRVLCCVVSLGCGGDSSRRSWHRITGSGASTRSHLDGHNKWARPWSSVAFSLMCRSSSAPRCRSCGIGASEAVVATKGRRNTRATDARKRGRATALDLLLLAGSFPHVLDRMLIARINEVCVASLINAFIPPGAS